MTIEKLNAKESLSAGMIIRPSAAEVAAICGRYHLEHLRDGKVIHEEDFDNLITTVGKNDMLEKYLEGSAWSTGTIYMGLKSTGTPNAADTMASHASWTELNISASSGIRQSVSLGAAAAGVKATDAVSAWSITAAGPTSVFGCFIVIGGTSANGNTTGTLFSAGDFSASRSVISGDTLNVSYSVTI